jgi:hypothetical protein
MAQLSSGCVTHCGPPFILLNASSIEKCLPCLPTIVPFHVANGRNFVEFRFPPKLLPAQNKKFEVIMVPYKTHAVTLLSVLK